MSKLFESARISGMELSNRFIPFGHMGRHGGRRQLVTSN
jgi:hypothetical protein